ncbi:leucine-rich repeat domain-containing protein [Schlesneria paludicola]|uniref:ribonuclease inhibitor n=1 Tax=Schlesneria paludicola TaxID=360056 RepID=UPI00029A780C|nr:ribonuclease inhibitor [Schlesneria paludicola]
MPLIIFGTLLYLCYYRYLDTLVSGVGVKDYNSARNLFLLGATLGFDREGRVVGVEFEANEDGKLPSDVGDTVLRYLLPLDRLRRLSLEPMTLTQDGCRRLASLTKLISLRLAVPNDEALSDLAALTELGDLSVEGNICGRGFHRFPETSELHSLRIASAKNISDEIRSINTFRGIRRLVFSYTPITDNHLRALRPTVARLFGFEAYGSEITDDGVREFQDLPELERLSLVGAHITDTGVMAMRQLPKLRELTLVDNELTDNCIKHLKQFSQLRHVSLCKTKVSVQGGVRLKQALPDVELLKSYMIR